MSDEMMRAHVVIPARLGKSCCDPCRHGIEFILPEKRLDLLRGVLPQRYLLCPAFPEQQIQVALWNPVGSAKTRGNKFPLADIAVDRFSAHLQILGRLLGGHDLGKGRSILHSTPIFSNRKMFVETQNDLR